MNYWTPLMAAWLDIPPMGMSILSSLLLGGGNYFISLIKIIGYKMHRKRSGRCYKGYKNEWDLVWPRIIKNEIGSTNACIKIKVQNKQQWVLQTTERV